MLVVTKISCAIYNFYHSTGNHTRRGAKQWAITYFNWWDKFRFNIYALGSDTYWISAGKRNITIVQNELYYHLVLTIFTAALVTIFVITDNFDITKYLMIF